MTKAYITGSSIISALGKNKNEAISKIKTLNNDNYSSYTKDIFANKRYYSIKDNLSNEHRFYKIINTVILDALSDANIDIDDCSQLNVYIGSTSLNASVIQEQYSNTKNTNVVCTTLIKEYITKLLNLQKSIVIFSTACTSSANALIYASDQIKSNQISKALVIGLEFYNDLTYNGFNSLMLLSQQKDYAPLDLENSDGLILGEACSAVVLQTNSNNTDDFYILSSDNLFDNYSPTSSNPNGEIIYKTICNTLEKEKLSLEKIDFINIHSAGSQSSNEAELNAILKLEYKNNFTCMKPFIGHTLGACSINEIVLLNSCIKNNFIPNTLSTSENKSINLSKQTTTTNAAILFTYNGFSGNNISFIISNKE